MITVRLFNQLMRKIVLQKFGDFDDLILMREHFLTQDARFSNLDRFHNLTRDEKELNGVPSEWIRVPNSRPDHIILYLHGGAFCLKTPSLHGQMLARICSGATERRGALSY